MEDQANPLMPLIEVAFSGTTRWSEKDTKTLIERTSEYITTPIDWNKIGAEINKTAKQCTDWYDFLCTLKKEIPEADRLENKPPKKRKRRRSEDVEKDFACQVAGCDKSYGTEGALKLHMKRKHSHIPYVPSYLVEYNKDTLKLYKQTPEGGTATSTNNSNADGESGGLAAPVVTPKRSNAKRKAATQVPTITEESEEDSTSQQATDAAESLTNAQQGLTDLASNSLLLQPDLLAQQQILQYVLEQHKQQQLVFQQLQQLQGEGGQEEVVVELSSSQVPGSNTASNPTTTVATNGAPTLQAPVVNTDVDMPTIDTTTTTTTSQ